MWPCWMKKYATGVSFEILKAAHCLELALSISFLEFEMRVSPATLPSRPCLYSAIVDSNPLGEVSTIARYFI